MKTFVIAEAGSCHDGDIAQAFKLITAAKDAGADACKFQYWSSAECLAERRNAHDYLPVYQRYRVPHVWLSWLHLGCVANGIEFMATCYLPEDIPAVAPFVERFKVASFEAGDIEFLRAHGGYGKDVIVSTGMTEFHEYFGQHEELQAFMRKVHPGKVYWLHCVSAYPCPPEQANLSAMRGMQGGYSDHTRNVLTGAFATCLGAQILEVHFRLDDTDPANPDYATALTPTELTEYVRLVRLAEVMLGDGIKKPQPAEAEMSKYRVLPDRDYAADG